MCFQAYFNVFIVSHLGDSKVDGKAALKCLNKITLCTLGSRLRKKSLCLRHWHTGAKHVVHGSDPMTGELESSLQATGSVPPPPLKLLLFYHSFKFPESHFPLGCLQSNRRLQPQGGAGTSASLPASKCSKDLLQQPLPDRERSLSSGRGHL